VPLLARNDAGELAVAGRPWYTLIPQHAQLGRVRRRLYEFAGSERYSRPGLDGLDRALERHLPAKGVFVEAGAHDGYVQSNTYYLERVKGWSGVLVEPIPELYARCIKERRRSKVFNCALVAPDFNQPTIRMRYGDLFSLVPGAQGSSIADEHHLRASAVETYAVDVPARTITSVLDEANVSHVDFLSLDVEGYEPEVLSGLDLERYAPTYLLVEILEATRTRRRIDQILGPHYEAVEAPTPRDMLYRRR
jgi:FkbM family methyltransferase